MIARYLEINCPNNEHIQLFKETGYKYLQKIKNIETNNEQDKKEIENYRPREYFINILNKIDINKIQTKIGSYQYLLLSLLTYQPVLRTSFYITCKFIKNIKENDKTHNFIWICKDIVFYIVNDDKVKNASIYKNNKFYLI